MSYDCIVIGKGPAGISASLYVKRANLKVLVIGKDGGALEKTKEIDNYYGFKNTISGKELLINGIEQAKRLGVELETDEVIGLEFDGEYIVKTRNSIFKAKTLILATGARRNVPTIKGIKEFEGKGVSYCAICDAFFYKNKDVAVLGSGDYAISEAKQLLPVANSVTILTNGEQIVENRNTDLEKIQLLEKPINHFRGNEVIEEVVFNDNSNLKTSGVFIALGVASSTDLAKKLGAITNGNYIVVDKNMKTNVPGLYACGDCTGGLLQISKAVYEGAVAGLDAIKYIRKK